MHSKAGLKYVLIGPTLIGILALFSTGCSSGPDTSQKLPLGWMDSPAQGAVLRGTATLSGWALCEDGIENIAVYVDRSFVQMAGKLNGARPDVISLYPAFGGVTDMEWIAKLETASLSPGPHDILARAISKKGAVRDLGSVKVTIER
jgi:hypothetical protein